MQNFNGYKTVRQGGPILHCMHVYFFSLAYISLKGVENSDPCPFPSSSLARGGGCLVGDVSRKYRSLCSLC